MKKLLIVGLAYIGLLLGVYTTAEANLITNGSFELGTYTDNGSGFQTLYAPSSIPGWEVKSGSIDWIGSYWDASDGARSIDLAGEYAHGLIMGTQFATETGKTYRVHFDMAGNPDKSYDKALLAVAIKNEIDGSIQNMLYQNVFTFNQDNHSHRSMGWVTNYFDFVAVSNFSNLMFGDVTGDPGQAWGAALDNVRVDLAPVPEPSTLLLLGAGLAGFGIFGRRFRRSSLK